MNTVDFILATADGETLLAWPTIAEAETFCRLAWPGSYSNAWHCPTAGRPFRPVFDAAGVQVATITQFARPAAAPGFVLNSPESVADQKRRHAAEKDAAKKRADAARLADLAAAPMVGRSVDTTFDMFESNLFNRR